MIGRPGNRAVKVGALAVDPFYDPIEAGLHQGFPPSAGSSGKRPGLLKNAPLVTGYGWGRNGTLRFGDPVPYGIEKREASVAPKYDCEKAPALALRSISQA